MNDATTRTCNRCGITKLIEAFAKASWCTGGRRSTCQECRFDRPVRRASNKTCIDCTEVLPADSFHKRSSAADGLAARCKSCMAKFKAEAYQRNRDQVLAKNRESYRANREKRVAYQVRWKKANPEKVREYGRAYYERNRERVDQQVRAWREANPERVRENLQRNTRLRRARKKGAEIGPIDLDVLWTGLCGICGDPIDRDLPYPDPLSKSVDHIVPLSKGGAHEQSNLQWAHLVCNNRKGAKAP